MNQAGDIELAIMSFDKTLDLTGVVFLFYNCMCTHTWYNLVKLTPAVRWRVSKLLRRCYHYGPKKFRGGIGTGASVVQVCSLSDDVLPTADCILLQYV